MNTPYQSEGQRNSRENRQAGKASLGPIVAIVLGIALIAGVRAMQFETGIVKLPAGVVAAEVKDLKPITEADHTRGVAGAPMKLIEYSDLQCPFCKIFHQAMLEITPEYIATGQLQWAYRHYPLISIHENAKDMAIATECAFKLGGHDAFWKMADGIFADPAQKFDMTKLPVIAKDTGLNAYQYWTCFSRKQTVAVVDAHMTEGAAIGIMGTPYAVIISPKGKTFPLTRAYSADELRDILGAVATQ